MNRSRGPANGQQGVALHAYKSIMFCCCLNNYKNTARASSDVRQTNSPDITTTMVSNAFSVALLYIAMIRPMVVSLSRVLLTQIHNVIKINLVSDI